ncbi:MAG: hypothetical protein M1814_003100 [Vezdaea aestivalis]|nr:MAG: hypothetical protein M1814_003100 [Vezdaea aestivalis]
MDESRHVSSSNADPATRQSGAPDSQNLSSSIHKRSLSGSILSRLSFLKSSVEQASSPPAETNSTDDLLGGTGSRPPKSPAIAPVDQKKNRRRKGSLRKTALLGPGRMRQERRGSNMDANRPVLNTQRRHQVAYNKDIELDDTSPISPLECSDSPTFGFENFSSSTLRNGDYGPNGADTARLSPRSSQQSSIITTASNSKIDISTTDEEEGLTFARPESNQALKKPTLTSSDYFPPQTDGAQRRKSKAKVNSPLSTFSTDPIGSLDEWDYSETAWWGWVVLIVTWIVFVVGMGSCFEVWSWAWDVGETPYAPPELEDDPTLPIVGYYPALIILTAVMAWVWVVIAWVGMKYFRHAKISGEET